MDITIRRKYFREKNGSKTLALKDIELSFPEGETTLIIGTSGAGKSTLIKCITGMTKYEGPLPKYDKRDIAYIPQHPALNMSLTVYDTVNSNLKFAKVDGKRFDGHNTDWWTKKYLRDVALTDLANKKAGTLSGGQKQRLSIAKELARDKKIIIADEIDTGLDCGVARALVEKLVRITHDNKLTTIVISHNIVNIELYDNVIVLAKYTPGTPFDREGGFGQIAFSGKTKNIKSYFGVKEYVDILKKVNSKEEEGEGLAYLFINKHNENH